MYSKIASTIHIREAPQYIRHKVPILSFLALELLYQIIVQVIAANAAVSNVIFMLL